jgi:hypothetical protein
MTQRAFDAVANPVIIELTTGGASAIAGASCQEKRHYSGEVK